MTTVYDFEATSISGKPVALAQFKGQPLLIVNTASACGFTPSSPGWKNCTRPTAAAAQVVLGFRATSLAHKTKGATTRSPSSASSLLRGEFP